MHKHIHKHTHTHTQKQTNIHTHTHKHTHRHTHKHTYTEYSHLGIDTNFGTFVFHGPKDGRRYIFPYQSVN